MRYFDESHIIPKIFDFKTERELFYKQEPPQFSGDLFKHRFYRENTFGASVQSMQESAGKAVYEYFETPQQRNKRKQRMFADMYSFTRNADVLKCWHKRTLIHLAINGELEAHKERLCNLKAIDELAEKFSALDKTHIEVHNASMQAAHADLMHDYQKEAMRQMMASKSEFPSNTFGGFTVTGRTVVSCGDSPITEVARKNMIASMRGDLSKTIDQIMKVKPV